MGGLGLRLYVELCRPAFIDAVELAMTKLYDGFCPLLADTVGGEDRFDGEWEGRWKTLLASGHRTGRELAASLLFRLVVASLRQVTTDSSVVVPPLP